MCLSKSNSYVMPTVKPPLIAPDSYSLHLSSHDTSYLYDNKRTIFYGFDRCPCMTVISPRKGSYCFHVFVSTIVLIDLLKVTQLIKYCSLSFTEVRRLCLMKFPDNGEAQDFKLQFPASSSVIQGPGTLPEMIQQVAIKAKEDEEFCVDLPDGV